MNKSTIHNSPLTTRQSHERRVNNFLTEPTAKQLINCATRTYNPDVLSCLANLSNDEVFTPPEVANAMLDLLPQEIFENPETTFLDPACKSGVFLREIAKRLIKGLEPKIPNLKKRIKHIFKNQLYGISITELTSLLSRRSVYCSKYANSKFSVCDFETSDGNIRFKKTQHLWINGKCLHCGASQAEYGKEKRGEDLETHAYEFIHTDYPEEIFKMKFDVIIGNPPYQMDVGVTKDKFAIAIYDKFVRQAKKLKPRYLVMIIPARWYTGGRNLNNFRDEMLNDSHIRKLVDYPNPYDCFSGVDNPGGICYFLWDRETQGECEFSNFINNKITTTKRMLNEYPIFIRDIKGLNIIKKIQNLKLNSNKVLCNRISTQTPFGLLTSYVPKQTGVPCWFTQKIGLQFAYKKDINDKFSLLDKWKLLIPKAPIAGQTDFTQPVGLYYEGNIRIAKPGECCTQTWLVISGFSSLIEVESFKSYLLTKIVRFLILQLVVSQDVGADKFCFVPDLGHYEGTYTDEILCKRWNITEDEWNYIDSRIHNYDGR